MICSTHLKVLIDVDETIDDSPAVCLFNESSIRLVTDPNEKVVSFNDPSIRQSDHLEPILESGSTVPLLFILRRGRVFRDCYFGVPDKVNVEFSEVVLELGGKFWVGCWSLPATRWAVGVGFGRFGGIDRVERTGQGMEDRDGCLWVLGSDLLVTSGQVPT